MPVIVVVHRLKDFDEWIKIFKADPPPKVGRWRLFRGSDDRNRVHVVGDVAASEVKVVKDFLGSQHMQDVFKRVNAMSTAPLEFIWLDELVFRPGNSLTKSREFLENGVSSSCPDEGL
jgi:hypothetical protein